jgi:hypothetical protein
LNQDQGEMQNDNANATNAKITLALFRGRPHVVPHSELPPNFSRWGGASFEPGSLGPGGDLKQESREPSGKSN